MTCREALRRIVELSGAGGLDAALQEHLSTCAACREIALSSPQLHSEMPSAGRIAAIQADLSREWKPVRPLPAAGTQVVMLWCLYALLATAVPVWLGFHAVHVMRVWQALLYDGAFAAVAGLVAIIAVQRLNPGTRPFVNGTHALLFASAVLTALVLALFPNFDIKFFSAGVRCLETGCAVASIAAILFAFALRRTFASQPVAAGAAVGFLAGVCGATVLALHCTVLTTPHILTWHLTVLVIASSAGAIVGWLSVAGRARRRPSAGVD